ncbi:MAG: putative ABC transporter ATP-binding protein YbhF [Planctomycetes bacterium ADurb.Bin401]|nr:MAG: putative ABC transporter ATP-binding protein YbhF [Planctomycetes bacterium ADurb.Bin401]
MVSIIETVKLRKEFGTLVAVNDITFDLRQGQVLGLIGPNGAGKTTLIRMLCTLLPPTSGTVKISGLDIKRDYLKARKTIGYMPDFFNLYSDLTITECLEFFAESYGIEKHRIPQKINESLEFVALEHKRHEFIKHLSRGMVQRMGVASLLVRDPDVYLLDEPASGLDPQSRIQLRDILRRLSSLGKTIVISSHILTELSGFCTHIAIMNNGKLVTCGSVDEIQNKIYTSKKIRITVIDEIEKAKSLVQGFNIAAIEKIQDNTLLVNLSGSAEDLARLNMHLVSAGLKVIEFSEQKVGLEDLYMKISGNQ